MTKGSGEKLVFYVLINFFIMKENNSIVLFDYQQTKIRTIIID